MAGTIFINDRTSGKAMVSIPLVFLCLKTISYGEDSAEQGDDTAEQRSDSAEQGSDSAKQGVIPRSKV